MYIDYGRSSRQHRGRRILALATAVVNAATGLHRSNVNVIKVASVLQTGTSRKQCPSALLLHGG
jgi:hypothetical protein